MKRFGSLFVKITALDNLYLADENARKRKRKRTEIVNHDKHRMDHLKQLRLDLINKTFTTSPYSIFKIKEPKERLIYMLPYYPDRIVHHAIVNILGPIWQEVFIANSYSCIKHRGIHKCSNDLKKALKKDGNNTKYCLQLDIKKYYPSINHDILMAIISKKIKCKNTLSLLEDIVRSEVGLPIGNYLSQHLGNLYLTYFDHFVKEQLKVKYYFRYADDIVILHENKEILWSYFHKIQNYLHDNLKLTIKGNYAVFPVSEGIDFVGYVHYHTHTLLRKSIKKNMAKAAKKNKQKSLAAYWGWAKHCNSKNLLTKLNIDYESQ